VACLSAHIEFEKQLRMSRYLDEVGWVPPSS